MLLITINIDNIFSILTGESPSLPELPSELERVAATYGKDVSYSFTKQPPTPKKVYGQRKTELFPSLQGDEDSTIFDYVKDLAPGLRPGLDPLLNSTPARGRGRGRGRSAVMDMPVRFDLTSPQNREYIKQKNDAREENKRKKEEKESKKNELYKEHIKKERVEKKKAAGKEISKPKTTQRNPKLVRGGAPGERIAKIHAAIDTLNNRRVNRIPPPNPAVKGKGKGKGKSNVQTTEGESSTSNIDINIDSLVPLPDTPPCHLPTSPSTSPSTPTIIDEEETSEEEDEEEIKSPIQERGRGGARGRGRGGARGRGRGGARGRGRGGARGRGRGGPPARDVIDEEETSDEEEEEEEEEEIKSPIQERGRGGARGRGRGGARGRGRGRGRGGPPARDVSGSTRSRKKKGSKRCLCMFITSILPFLPLGKPHKCKHYISIYTLYM